MDAPTPEAPASIARNLLGALKILVGAFAVLWIIFGFPVLWWSNHGHHQDAQSDYTRIALADSGAASVELKSHVALEGRLLGSHILVSRRGGSPDSPVEYHLVPVVAPNWQEGQAARFVLKIDRLEDLQDERASNSSPPGRVNGPPDAVPQTGWLVLGRLDGSASVTAEQQFKKMGVPLATDAQIVQWVRSRDGGPDLESIQREIDMNWEGYIVSGKIIGGAVAVLIALCWTWDWWGTRRAA